MGTATGDGAIAALTGKPRLHFFQVGDLVTDAGLARFHEFPMFKNWQGGEVRYSLLSPNADPTFLWLNLKAPFTDAGLARLAGLDGLFALSLFGFRNETGGVTPAGLSALADLPNLGWLGCTGQLCDDTSMQQIAALPRLRLLMCQDAQATDAGFAALSRSSSIEHIWGRNCRKLTQPGFEALSTMPALHGLAVSCMNLDDQALSALPKFPALREIVPIQVPDDGFRHIGRCEQLEALWCMYCQDTGDVATELISGLRHLKTYYAGRTRITDRPPARQRGPRSGACEARIRRQSHGGLHARDAERDHSDPPGRANRYTHHRGRPSFSCEASTPSRSQAAEHARRDAGRGGGVPAFHSR